MPNAPEDARTGEEGYSSYSTYSTYSPHTARLATILALAYLLVIVYASLQPFRGWAAPPAEVLRFLFAPWPRYITLEDVAINVAAYFPLGFLLSVGLGARYGAAPGAAAAVLVALLLSLAMEAAQMYLPTRISSNVDLLTNGIGALIGATTAPLFAPTRVLGGPVHAVRHRLLIEGAVADVGLVIVFLWLLTHFHPTTQFFGTGSLRVTADLPEFLAHSPGLAFATEALVVLLNLMGVGLLLAALMREGARSMAGTGVLVGAALAVKLFTAAALVQTPTPLAWFTPGVLAGLVGGLPLLYVACRLPRAARLALAATCILAATIAINVAPDNPYQTVPPRLLAGGPSHFLSFAAIVRALSELWPALAVTFLLYALGRRDLRSAP